MLEPIPSAAKFPYQAFALMPADAEEAVRLAKLHLVDLAAARKGIVAWFERAAPKKPDLKKTPLDPRVGRVIQRLAVFAKGPSYQAPDVAAAIAGWSDAPREVFAEVEVAVMNAALRTERLLELDAPAIIVEGDLRSLQQAIAMIDSPPPPPPHPSPPDDSYEFLEVSDGIVRNARYDLSLGMHSETLRVLEDLAPKRVGRDAASGLCGTEPLVPFADLERRAKQAAEGERMLLERLRFWKTGPDPIAFAEVALELADVLSGTTAPTRKKVTAELDTDTPRDLKDGDYVAAAEAHLRTMAEGAKAAASEGLVLLSEMSRSLSYG